MKETLILVDNVREQRWNTASIWNDAIEYARKESKVTLIPITNARYNRKEKNTDQAISLSLKKPIYRDNDLPTYTKESQESFLAATTSGQYSRVICMGTSTIPLLLALFETIEKKKRPETMYIPEKLLIDTETTADPKSPKRSQLSRALFSIPESIAASKEETVIRSVSKVAVMSQREFDTVRRYKTLACFILPVQNELFAKVISNSKKKDKTLKIGLPADFLSKNEREGSMWFINSVFQHIEHEVEQIELLISSEKMPKNEYNEIMQHENISIVFEEKLFNEADLIVFPYVMTKSNMRRLLRALSGKIPVITHPSVGEILADSETNLFLTSEKIIDFAAKAYKLLTDTKYRGDYIKSTSSVFDSYVSTKTQTKTLKELFHGT